MSSRGDGPERYKKLGELFAQAQELGDSELASFLDRSCGSDPDLRKELQDLLAFKEERAGFLDSIGLNRHRFEQLVPPMTKALQEHTERPVQAISASDASPFTDLAVARTARETIEAASS